MALVATQRLIRCYVEDLWRLPSPYPVLQWHGRITPGGLGWKERRLNTSCAICQEDIRLEHDVMYCAAQCGHSFHHVCIHEWHRTKEEPECPICRGTWIRRICRPVRVVYRGMRFWRSNEPNDSWSRFILDRFIHSVPITSSLDQLE